VELHDQSNDELQGRLVLLGAKEREAASMSSALTEAEARIEEMAQRLGAVEDSMVGVVQYGSTVCSWDVGVSGLLGPKVCCVPYTLHFVSVL
jgi:hypothetical protein